MLKTVWLVDGGYLLKASRIPFDYLKLKTVLEDELGAPFVESHYLDAVQEPPSDSQLKFHNWLKSAPPYGPQLRVKLYRLKTVSVICSGCGHEIRKEIQKGVDVGIATLMIRLATQNIYDRLLLCAGDGDFEDAIGYIKEVLHKEVWLAGWSNSVSTDLQSYANRVIWLDDHYQDIRKD